MTKKEKFLLRLSDDIQEFVSNYADKLVTKCGFDVFEICNLAKQAIATAFLILDNKGAEDAE